MGATAWTPAAAACLALCPTKPATLRNCDNRDKLIQLSLEDIRSRGSQQNASRQGVAAAVGQGRAEEAQAEAVGPAPKLLLHGREMPRMLPSSVSPPAEEPGSLKAALSAGRAKSNLHLGVVF